MNLLLSILWISYQVAALAAFFVTIDGIIRDSKWDDFWWSFKQDAVAVVLGGAFLLCVSVIMALLLPIMWLWKELKKSYQFGIKYGKDNRV